MSRRSAIAILAVFVLGAVAAGLWLAHDTPDAQEKSA
jgi:hypothetical protein